MLLIRRVVCWLSLFAVPIMAQDKQPEEKSDKQLVEAWLKVSLKHAQDYVFHPVNSPDEKFTMLPQAVFRHSQPVRGDDIGAVYLWVDRNQRPAVIATTFAFTTTGDLRSVVHEMHSLASESLTVDWRKRSRWKPMTAGLTWKPVPKTPLVDRTEAGRLRQAREITRRFTAESIDHKEKRWELRLLPKPIHQFDVEQPTSVVGGTLNVFCQGTDPELVLALEARKENDGYVWYYAPATFTDYGLKLQLDGNEVWTNPAYSHSPTGAYWADSVGEERLSPFKEAMP